MIFVDSTRPEQNILYDETINHTTGIELKRTKM
jgi:hypothetical protein